MIDARQHIIGKYIPFDFETITIGASAIGFTASKLAANPKPKRAFVTFETAQCRVRMDNTDPDATTGHLYNPTQSLLLEGYSQLNGFKAIRTGATSATIQVTYLR